MVTAGIPTEVIRRWGRWLSDCWCRYVLESSQSLYRKIVRPERARGMRAENASYRRCANQHRTPGCLRERQ